MCSGRVDIKFVLRAFLGGVDGVFIGGCRLNECNYTTQGNYDALAMVLIAKKLLSHIGVSPERLRIEFMTSGDGILFAQIMNDFSRTIKALGPLGQGENRDLGEIKAKLGALLRLSSYIKLVEREKLRIPVKSEAAYREFFKQEEVDLDKLTLAEITGLLGKGPMSTGEIASQLNLTPSEVSKYMNTASRYGLVRFDRTQKKYAIA